MWGLDFPRQGCHGADISYITEDEENITQIKFKLLQSNMTRHD